MHKYNGVALPDQPQYDKAANPCAIIALLPHGYVFEVLSAPLRQGAILGEVSASNVTYSNWNLASDGKSWEVGAEGVSAQSHSFALADILWTNWDITDAEGNVLKKASVPICLIDMYSFKVGMSMALAVPARPLVAAKEIVAYLYNGVRLPKLPEWDMVAYPYAVIVYNGISQGRFLFAFKKEQRVTGGSTIYTWSMDEGETYLRCSLPKDATEWSTITEYTKTTDQVLAYVPKWGNYDVYVNGTLSVEASEPVPVYE